MAKVRSECNKVAGMSVFQVPVSKSMKLEEFEQTQAQVSTQVILSLQHTCHETKISKVQFVWSRRDAVVKVTCVKILFVQQPHVYKIVTDFQTFQSQAFKMSLPFSANF